MATESPRLITYEEYMTLPEGFYNLIEGELIVTPSASGRHQDLLVHLTAVLYNWNREAKAGRVRCSPSDVLLSLEGRPTVLQPDLYFVAKGDSRSTLTKQGATGAPDLVVEIVSPGSTRLDGVRKRNLYERYGAREFWLVFPELDRVEVLRLGPDGRFGPPLMLGPRDQLESDLLPGFALDLGAFFATEDEDG